MKREDKRRMHQLQRLVRRGMAMLMPFVLFFVTAFPGYTQDASNDFPLQDPPVELSSYIQTVDLERFNQEGQPEPLIENEQGAGLIEPDQEYRLTIRYELPAEAAKSHQGQLVWQLPSLIHFDKPIEGIVENDQSLSGQYTIDPAGKLSIHYPEIEKTEMDEDALIEGMIQVSLHGSQLELTNPEKTVLPFTDEIHISVRAGPDSSSETDISSSETPSQEESSQENSSESSSSSMVKEEPSVVSEDSASPQRMPGRLQLKTSSELTQSGAVHVTLQIQTPQEAEDVLVDALLMEGKASIDWSSVVARQDDENLELDTLKKDGDGRGFSLKIEEISDAEPVQIEYDLLVDPLQPDEITKVQTLAKVQAPDTQMVESRTPVVSITNTLIAKEGKLNASGQGMDWTIILNKGAQNLEGWQLHDWFNRSELEQSVKIDPPINGQSTITLPFTFPATRQTYTLTYSTQASLLPGQRETLNRAALEKKEQEVSTKEIRLQGIQNKDPYAPLNTKPISNIWQSDEQVRLEWQSRLTPDRGALASGWMVEEKLHNDQQFTRQDQDALLKTLQKVFVPEGQSVRFYSEKPGANQEGKIGFESDTVDVAFLQSEEGAPVTRYQVIGKVPLNKEVSWTFTSTGKVRAKDSNVLFQIDGTVDSAGFQSSVKTEQKVLRLLEVYDRLYKDKAVSEHRIGQDQRGNYRLEWGVAIRIDDQMTSGFTLTDTLPWGAELDGNSLTLNIDGRKIALRADGQAVAIPAMGQIRLVHQNQQVKAEFSKQLASALKGKEVFFLFDASLTWNTQWIRNEKVPGRYDASLTDQAALWVDGTQLAKEEQTQKISWFENERVLMKTGFYNKETGLLSYEIDINPNGRRILNDGSKQIYFEDELLYPNAKDYHLQLIPESVGLYALDGKGREVQLGSQDWSYQVNPDGSSNDGRHAIQITGQIPDGKALKLRYQYQVFGSAQQNVGVWNRIDLVHKWNPLATADTWVSAEPTGYTTDETPRQKMDIELKAVDSENYSLPVAKAVFELQQYDPASRTFVGYDSNLVTNDQGTVSLSGIEKQRAYRLIQLEAPFGYERIAEPWDFYVAGDQARQMPNGFEKAPTTHVISELGGIVIPNEDNRSNLTIEKKWQTIEGWTESGGHPAVKANVYKIESDQKPVKTTYTVEFNNSQASEPVVVVKGAKVRVIFDALNHSGYGWYGTRNNNLDGAGGSATLVEEHPVQKDGQTYTRFVYEVPIQAEFTHIHFGGHGLSDPIVKEIWPMPPKSTLVETVELNKQNNYSMTLDDMITGELKNGRMKYYTYFVKEERVSGYATSYVNNGIQGGTITLINRRDSQAGFLLPETGSNHASPIGPAAAVASGTLAVLAYGIWKRRKENEDEFDERNN